MSADRQAHADTLKAEALRQKLQSITTADIEKMPSQVQYAEEHYLLLNVRRTSVLQDTFDQLWQRRKSELRRPLRVRLGQTDELEVGHDLGGVQIEFFNLVCREIMAEDLREQAILHPKLLAARLTSRQKCSPQTHKQV